MAVLIEDVKARLCYNSRGEETVEVDVLAGGCLGRAAAPAGASVGRHEAVSFPKGGAKACVELVGSYSQRLVGRDAGDVVSLTEFLREVDGTDNYQRIGGSATYAVTLAAAGAAAQALSQPLFSLLSPNGPHYLPYPLGNVLGGGKHAGPGSPDIQEFLVCPTGAKNIQQAVAANISVHRKVRRIIEEKDPLFTGGKGDEGAWAPRLNNDEAFEVVTSAIDDVSRTLGFDVRLGIDFAASSFWDDDAKAYVYSRSGLRLLPDQQIEYVIELVGKYKPVYIEDPLHEEAFEGFCELSRRLKKIYVTGDDLFATNVQRLTQGVRAGAGNAAILKVNQVGGLGDALKFAETARSNRYALITSHRSGDTSDSHIAHVAVATGSKMLKTGVVGGERVAKLNELLRIDEGLKGSRMTPLEV